MKQAMCNCNVNDKYECSHRNLRNLKPDEVDGDVCVNCGHYVFWSNSRPKAKKEEVILYSYHIPQKVREE